MSYFYAFFFGPLLYHRCCLFKNLMAYNRLMVVLVKVHILLTIIGVAIKVIIRIGFLENNVTSVLLIM